MNTATTSRPLTPAGDAFAASGSDFRLRISRAASRVWRALEEAGRARAEQHMKNFANQCEAHQPELAREIRAALRQGPMA